MDWRGETAYIIGGGPSLKGMDLSGLRDRRTIALNNAYQIVPDPDILFFADARWWDWHRDRVPPTFSGRILTPSPTVDRRVERLYRDMRFEAGGPVLSTDPEHLAGHDSGYMALNLCLHLGVARIVLLGYDMGFQGGTASHWHAGHPVPTKETNYTKAFGPLYPPLIAALQARGIEIVRATPSSLTYIPERPLADLLADDEIPVNHRQVA
ncbi:hypothetical protein BAMBUS_04220 [Brevundimonas phage vB_BpoS-Bambus]|nr:hypothetical protein BAMBUS_04220 [Brevundimonas phage vB_BpoS-Bambus]